LIIDKVVLLSLVLVLVGGSVYWYWLQSNGWLCLANGRVYLLDPLDDILLWFWNGQAEEEECFELVALETALLAAERGLKLALEYIDNDGFAGLEVVSPRLSSPLLHHVLTDVVSFDRHRTLRGSIQVFVYHVKQVREQLLAVFLNWSLIDIDTSDAKHLAMLVHGGDQVDRRD
jgi:hypothetical protein